MPRRPRDTATLQRALRNRRRELGLRQKDAAARCGWKSFSSWHHIETGRYDPTWSTLVVMAKALAWTPAQLAAAASISTEASI